ncbi:MAG: hypothetical protein J2P27_08050 [Actinobacteria bacterium]|nr:hypothetical protein [Actinomycetota bacterium]
MAKSGIPIADRAYLNAPITGRLHSRPWRQAPIAYDQAEQLARMLSAATFVVISYLSGMRPGEVLNLARGCTHHDPSLGLWLVEGLKWKGAVDDDGNKLPEGQPREDPWTVVPVVARAVSALERLHPHRLLFPAQRLPTRTRGNNTGKTRLGEGRTTVAVAKDLAEFVNRVNDFCVRTGRPDERIPSDPHGGMSTSRFRRTLAWHIVRRPRGLVAGAIQYGHLHVQITLGYAGSYDSGYPDEHAYEEWLYRLETLAEDEGLLGAGEHVSGPAADTYRHRVRAAHARFAGRVLTNTKQAKDMLANPLLQIYPGRAMTCVLDPAKALCQLSGAEGSTRHTPDQHDCRPNCQNIAYTDRDIGQLKTRAQELHKIVDDPLAPSIRHQRERHELDRISGIIRRHEHRGQTT